MIVASRLWLILDVSNLAYRALYTTGDLSYEGTATGVLFGLFRDIRSFQEEFATERVAFCFDGGHDVRKAIYPLYKRNRHRWEDDELARKARQELGEQLDRMRKELLPKIGYQNVFWQKGYEADDVIASLCLYSLDGDEAVVVSSDNDLWQLLEHHKITCWNPVSKKPTTAASFRREWGISPSQWADVKAIAGCSGDNVVGLRGIGEKTAAKFLSGVLKRSAKSYGTIIDGNDVWRQNLPLVMLPFEGTNRFDLVDDDVEESSWDRAMNSLGIKTLGRGR